MAKVVHKSSPSAVQALIDRLQAEGVNAYAVDEPNFIALLFAFGTYRVRVAVPDEEERRAKEVLDAWDSESAPRLAELTRQVRRQFLLATLVTGVVAALVFLVQGGLSVIAGVALFLLWIACLLLIAVAERMRSNRAGHPTDSRG